jgi:AbrB family looped-hinge helix DNA binding protein
MTTTVAENNQVSIPPEIVREFDIRPGTELEWAKGTDGNIIIKPLFKRGELARQVLGAGRRWLRPECDPIADLIKEREQDSELDEAGGQRWLTS